MTDFDQLGSTGMGTIVLDEWFYLLAAFALEVLLNTNFLCV